MDTLVLILFIIAISLFIWATIDVIRTARKGNRRTINWFWIFIFIPIAGPLLYFQLKDRQ